MKEREREKRNKKENPREGVKEESIGSYQVKQDRPRVITRGEEEFSLDQR